MPTRGCQLLVSAVCIASAGGCYNPTAVEAWQASLGRYVAEQGHGDVNVLRRTDRPPSESDFGLIGAATAGFPFIAPRRTDANGVLLGHRVIGGPAWFVYLVGMVEFRGWFVNWPLDKPRVREIRLIAVSGQGGEFTWMTGEADPVALDRYCAPQRERWRQSDPSRADSPEAPTVFPTEADAFEMTVEEGTVTVVDRYSEAVWTLAVMKKSSVVSDQSSARKELMTDN